MSLTGTFIDGNRAAEALSGYSRNDLIGKSFLKLTPLPAGQIPRAAASLARCALGYSVGPDAYRLRRKDGTEVDINITTVPVQKDGSIRWFLVRGHLVKDSSGKPLRMIGTDTDVTRLKEMESGYAGRGTTSKTRWPSGPKNFRKQANSCVTMRSSVSSFGYRA
ncbi:MAG: hypothetical protein CME19_25865 [Gemmatimonadetes bacterium]|nr:hypothetical protein [Gemmatimonadota bacterium]